MRQSLLLLRKPFVDSVQSLLWTRLLARLVLLLVVIAVVAVAFDPSFWQFFFVFLPDATSSLGTDNECSRSGRRVNRAAAHGHLAQNFVRNRDSGSLHGYDVK